MDMVKFVVFASLPLLLRGGFFGGNDVYSRIPPSKAILDGAYERYRCRPSALHQSIFASLYLVTFMNAGKASQTGTCIGNQD